MPVKYFSVGERVLIKTQGTTGTVTKVMELNIYGGCWYLVKKDDSTLCWCSSVVLEKLTAAALEGYWMRKVHQGFSVSNILLDDMHHYFINRRINTKRENETMPTENMEENMNQIRWVPMNINVLRDRGTPAADVAIKKVIFNAPATIVMWEDGTKTVVKCSENDTYDPEKGLAMAFMKKTLGNKGNYYEVVKKALKDYHPEEKVIDQDHITAVMDIPKLEEDK